MADAKRVAAGVALLTMAACGGNDPPRLAPVGAQRAAVDVELAIALEASDPEDDELELSFDADLPDIQTRARITGGKDGTATFRWTPLLSDLGDHTFTFRASDGRERVTRRAVVTVAASEGQGAPVFVQPLGTGTTLDLAHGSCLEVPVVVSDPDTPGVTLSQVEPAIEGAELAQDSELTGTWTFCPTREQIASGSRFALRLAADDYEHPTVIKDYLVVLLGDSGESCPGEVPTVTHTAADWSTIDDLVVSARVRDAEGLKFEPLLYYTLEPPADPVDVSRMVQLTMSLDSGSMTDGEWTGRIPNPVANGAAGSEADVYYVIAATDNDDLDGSCDHTAFAPAGGAFSATATNPGGTGGRDICAPCTADAQCGGADDLCVAFGGATTCFAECDTDGDCPSEHYCSASTFTSVDGQQGRQCLPVSLVCEGTDPVCSDDSYEPNDDLFAATPLGLGTHGVTSCPADEDWFEVTVGSEGDLELILDGGSASDLDLVLYDWWGLLLDQSDSLSSFEAATACVPPGDYLVRVLAYGSAENAYDLDVAHVPGSCGGSCDDDGNEPDDDFLDARAVDLDSGVFRSRDQQICAFDEDWYEVYVYAGEEVWVTLDFQQDAPDGDLDLMLVDGDGYILAGCTEDDPSWCDGWNGQSATSDEQMGLEIGATDTYYVIVRGWDGATNDYDVCIGLSYWDCP
jgi:hypothetical protein